VPYHCFGASALGRSGGTAGAQDPQQASDPHAASISSLAEGARARYIVVVRRLGLFILVVALVLGARLLFHHPVEVTLELALADASALRQADLKFTDEHERVVRDLRLAFPSGAAAREHHTIRLTPGDYAVGARLSYAGRPERLLTRRMHVEASGTYPLDF
jgi:hypothetical protein